LYGCHTGSPNIRFSPAQNAAYHARADSPS
jgi:hypothetical protein